MAAGPCPQKAGRGVRGPQGRAGVGGPCVPPCLGTPSTHTSGFGGKPAWCHQPRGQSGFLQGAPHPWLMPCLLSPELCSGDVPEVEIVSLLGEQLPRYTLRADTVFGYDHDDWLHARPSPPEPLGPLTPQQIEETLRYFRECLVPCRGAGGDGGAGQAARAGSGPRGQRRS